METLTFFIGSYTEYPIPDFGGIGHGIYSAQLNLQSGKIKVLGTTEVRNPSYLVLSEDQRSLYCCTELDEKDHPMINFFGINADFSLEFKNSQPVPGGYPCHINLFENNALVACYATGNVLQYPLDEVGELRPLLQNHGHQGASKNIDRQESPHAHQVALHPNGKDVYVCDLGIDIVKAYHLQEGQLVPNSSKDIRVGEGGGPRHMAFNASGELAYVLNELTGEVSVVKQTGGKFEQISGYSSLPQDYKGVPSSSAIRMHPNGKFLYVANRQLEAITIYQIKQDGLEVLDYQYTQGKELREFNITPDGKWLIACHQNSHDTVVYKIQNEGKLLESYRTWEILSPVCITFLRQ